MRPVPSCLRSRAARGMAGGGACFRVLLFLLLPYHSFAGVDNSHHDIRNYMPEQDGCSVCHERLDAYYDGALEDDLGRVGGLCVFLCHSGKGILPETDGLVPTPGPSLDTSSFLVERNRDYRSVFFTSSHGRFPANLKGRDGLPVPWPPPGLNWPGVEADKPLECTSCHAVHDDTYPPFLLAPLASTPGRFDGFCDRCHGDLATNNLSGVPDGTHPVDFPLNPSKAAARSGKGRHPRRIVVQRYGRSDGSGTVPVFDVPAPSPAELVGGASWNMGGHLASGTSLPMKELDPSDGSQQMGCFTCHSVHRPNTNGERNLVVVRTIDAGNAWNPLCTGCHGEGRSVRGDREEWNPGLTRWGHPGGTTSPRNDDGSYTVTTGAFRFRIASPATQKTSWGSRFGPRGELLCTTCHKIHFGVPGSLAVADLGQGPRALCKSCHDGSGNQPPALGEVMQPNTHHITLRSSQWSPRARQGFENPSWASTLTGMGDLSTGMDCADCHVANGTAHNWN